MPCVLDDNRNLYCSVPGGEPFVFDTTQSLSDWVASPHTRDDVARMLVHDNLPGHTENPDADAESWLQSWSQSGWVRFDDQFRHASDVARRTGVELLIRPTSSGMLSDAVCTLNWVARGAGQDAMLMLDPLAWIVPSMRRDLPDHLDRICELCIEMIDQRRVACVLLRSFAGERLGAVPLSEGDCKASMLTEPLSELIRCAPQIALLAEADLGLIDEAYTP